jgi:hypothetical protein
MVDVDVEGGVGEWNAGRVGGASFSGIRRGVVPCSYQSDI